MSCFIALCFIFAGIFITPIEHSGPLFITAGLFAIAAEIAYKKE